MSAVDDALRGALAHDLRPSTSAEPPRAVGDRTWSEVVRRAVHERVTGHLLHAVDAGAIRPSGRGRDELVTAHSAALALDLGLERRLLEVTALLADHAVEVRVLKGPAVAHLVYPDPARRSFGDVDLLVRGRDYDDAVAVLTGAGRSRRRFAEPRAGFDRRFGKGVCLVHPDGLDVDLHRSLVAGPFGIAMDPEELFASSSSFRLGGRTLHGLDSDGRFLHACVHVALGDPVPRLATLRDIAEMLQRDRVDPERVGDWCERWRCGIAVQRAITLTHERLPLPDADSAMTEWARRFRPSRWERRALRWYLGTRRSYAGQALAGIGAVQGLGAKRAYVGALLFPDRDYVRARDGGYARRAVRGIRLAAGARRERAGPPR